MLASLFFGDATSIFCTTEGNFFSKVGYLALRKQLSISYVSTPSCLPTPVSQDLFFGDDNSIFCTTEGNFFRTFYFQIEAEDETD